MFNNALAASQITKDQVNNALAEIGFDPVWKETTVPTESVVGYEVEQTVDVTPIQYGGMAAFPDGTMLPISGTYPEIDVRTTPTPVTSPVDMTIFGFGAETPKLEGLKTVEPRSAAAYKGV